MDEVSHKGHPVESLEMIPLYMVQAGVDVPVVAVEDISEGPLEVVLANRAPEENVFLVQWTGVGGYVRLTLLAGPGTSGVTGSVD